MRTIAQTTKSRRPTNERLRAEHAVFRSIILPVLGPRARLTADAEGWPIVPGRLGRLEWRGVEAGPVLGPRRVYAYTARPRLIAKLLAVPGVHRWQLGGAEAAVWIASADGAAIRATAQLLRPRVRRAPETGRPAEALAAARPRPGAATGPQ
jgi:hypothetical protein